MTAREYRGFAREKIRGKWGLLALISFIYGVLLGVVSAISPWIGSVVAVAVGGAFSLSFSMIALRVIKDETVKVEMLFDGFRLYVKSLLLYLIIGIFVFLWSLLLIVPGIVKAYSYSLSYYILAENKEISANDARKRSEELMYGNRWRLFCLDFSFIGWILLSLLTLGILLFWIIPYMEAAHAAFYRDLVFQTPTDGEKDVPEENFGDGGDTE